MYYLDVFEAFYRDKIRYLIVGGLAVNLFGVPRMTQDIDVIVFSDPANIKKIIDALNELGYQSRLPVDPSLLTDPEIVKDWVMNRNLVAFSFYHPKESYKVIDIVFKHPLDFDTAYERKDVRKVDGVPIYLVSFDDLITMKRSSGREKDLADIEMLIKAKRLEENKDEE